MIPSKVEESTILPQMQLSGIEMQPNLEVTGAEPKYQILDVNPDIQLRHDYLVKVIGTSVMSQSRASMLDQMIRLMQTPAEDGMPCVPREAVLDYLPDVNKRVVLQYFQKLKEERMAQEQQSQMNNNSMQQIQMLSQQLQELSGVVGKLEQRRQQDDEALQRDEYMTKGYQQGMNEARALKTQIDKSGQLPPELIQELAALDDEALSRVLEENPDLIDMM